MHEISLVRDLLIQTEQAMLQNQLASVSSICIEVGPLSGVDPLLVEQAFQGLIPSTKFADTRLVVIQPKLLASCLGCKHDFEVVHFHFRCPSCRSAKVQITSGDQMRLVSISTMIDKAEAIRAEEYSHE